MNDATLLLYSLPAHSQILLQTPILFLQPFDLIGESDVIFLESLEQLDDLRVGEFLRVALVDDLLLQLLVLLPQHIHVVLEQIDVLSHALHLLFVLLDPLRMVKALTIDLLLKVRLLV